MDVNPLASIEIGPATLVNVLLILAFWIAVFAVIIRCFSRRKVVVVIIRCFDRRKRK